MENLDKPEIINMFLKQYLLKNKNDEMYDFIKELYFELKKIYEYDVEGEQSTDDELDDLPMEKISVVKSKDGFYQLE
jgi:hypothetical protein